MASKKGKARFLLCLSAGEYAASLEPRKAYRSLPDADAEANGFVRVIDESGEDYLYPHTLFTALDLPTAAAEALEAGFRESA